MGPTSIQINIWALPGGPSADPERTVREAGVTPTMHKYSNLDGIKRMFSVQCTGIPILKPLE